MTKTMLARKMGLDHVGPYRLRIRLCFHSEKGRKSLEHFEQMRDLISHSLTVKLWLLCRQPKRMTIACINLFNKYLLNI